MIRLLLAITCGGFVGACGVMTEDRDRDVGMVLTAECGMCDTCKLTVEGEGTHDSHRKGAKVEKVPTM